MESKLTRQDPNTVGGKVAAKWSGLLGSVRGQSGRAGEGGGQGRGFAEHEARPGGVSV